MESWYSKLTYTPPPLPPPKKKKSFATLDGEIVDPKIAVNLKCGMYLKHTVHKLNIYTIWYI